VEPPLWSATTEPSVPEIVLGPHRYDIRHRALVMAVLGLSSEQPSNLLREAEAHVAAGADPVELDAAGMQEDDEPASMVDSLVARVGLPLVVRVDEPTMLTAALAAGASVVAGPVAAHVVAVASTGASVMLTTAEAGEAIGVPRSQVMVEPGPDGLQQLRQGLAAQGWPVVLSTIGCHASGAAQALGIALGARILRTTDVRTARRTADVMAAVLAAREPQP